MNHSTPHPAAVALGTFDGLHLGHRQVIGQILTSEYTPTVVAILPGGDRTSSWLLQKGQTQATLTAMGVKQYYPLQLADIQALSPEEFFQTYLVERLHAKEISCGFNFRFGKNAAGDTVLLQTLCDRHGITLHIAPAVTWHGQPVSSTRIRNALREGDPRLTADLLGQPFSFTAPVVHGKHLGRKLGFPTINQELPSELFMPKSGVYAVKTIIENQAYVGVCNIGIHPTVGNAPTPLAETYILDYEGNLYGKQVTVQLIAYLRPEQRFASLEALTDAIQKNAQQAQSIVTLR